MVAVIGDIHGCHNTLIKLLSKIKKKYKSVPLYCTGDLVDRGNFNSHVIEVVKEENINFVTGNHDLMFYYTITDPANPIGYPWIYNGNEKTLLDYEHNSHLLEPHLKLIGNAPLFYNLPECFISHAGISKIFKHLLLHSGIVQFNKFLDFFSKNLSNENGIIWNRSELMNLGKLQIVGHTRYRNVTVNQGNNSVYIDTSVDTGNKLSCIIVEKGAIIEILSVKTVPADIE